MKLISMTDFVLKDDYAGSPINMNKVYANFLKQPLELWMFVPCDEDGNVLKDCGLMPCYELDQYRQAKERCLFEGFYIKDGIVLTPEKQIMVQQSLLSKMTIENLIGLNHELTKTAIKQLKQL